MELSEMASACAVAGELFNECAVWSARTGVSQLKPHTRSGLRGQEAGPAYSHSIVPGGLLVTSNTTRLTSGTSLVIRVEMRSSTS